MTTPPRDTTESEGEAWVDLDLDLPRPVPDSVMRCFTDAELAADRAAQRAEALREAADAIRLGLDTSNYIGEGVELACRQLDERAASEEARHRFLTEPVVRERGAQC